MIDPQRVVSGMGSFLQYYRRLYAEPKIRATNLAHSKIVVTLCGTNSDPQSFLLTLLKRLENCSSTWGGDGIVKANCEV